MAAEASVNKSSLLCVSEKEIEGVRAALSMGDEASIRRDVDMVVEWYSKQRHLPRVPLDRDFVERMLIARKGSVEQTKQKIELLYTLKGLMPEISSPRDILHPDIQQTFKAFKFAAMPKMNHDLTRVHLHRLSKSSDSLVLADTFKYVFMMMEYRLKNDYALGDRYIYDLQDVNISHLTKINPIAMKKSETLLTGYGSRIFGFHFINSPPFVETIVSLAKSTLSAKLFGRLVVHSSLEDLYKVVSKSILPKEYGGEENSLDELALQWKEEFSKEENRQYLIRQESLKSNEALRIKPRPSDDILGIPGSFKTIEVD